MKDDYGHVGVIEK